MVMLGTEDTVIGEAGNEAGRQYVEGHQGPAYLMELVRGGHVSFTSCELYNEAYGNGIGESNSLSKPGTTYTPLPMEEQHRIVNSHGLAFLNAHLRHDFGGAAGADSSEEFNAEYLKASNFDAAEVIVKTKNV